jgi:hypothetical protein
MRALVLLVAVLFVALTAATAAAAQPFTALTFAHDGQRAAEVTALRNRDVTLTNDLAVLHAQVQTDQTLSNIAAARINPGAPTIVLGPYTPPPVIDASQLAEIPDATLAASNARIRAASENRH